MSKISVNNLSFSYNGSYTKVFENVSFNIDTDWKLGLIGRNGKGKTTLLKLLLGEYEYDGTIQKSVEFDYFPYEVKDKNKMTIEILNEIVPQVEDWQIIKELNLLNTNPEILYKKFELLSGGEQIKVLIASFFLKSNNFLLLDEPTNHLDSATKQNLIKYLKNKNGFILVSHDRMFLDKIVNKVYEIEYGAMTEYSGNYSFYEKQKQINYDRQLQDYEYQQKEIKRIMAIVEKFRYKKNKAKMAQSKLTYLEHMKLVDKPEKFDLNTFSTNFKPNIDSGNLVLSAYELEFGYDKPLSKVSFDLYRGRKLGIIGANRKRKSKLHKT